jgi:hypothetical protein
VGWARSGWLMQSVGSGSLQQSWAVAELQFDLDVSMSGTASCPRNGSDAGSSLVVSVDARITVPQITMRLYARPADATCVQAGLVASSARCNVAAMDASALLSSMTLDAQGHLLLNANASGRWWSDVESLRLRVGPLQQLQADPTLLVCAQLASSAITSPTLTVNVAVAPEDSLPFVVGSIDGERDLAPAGAGTSSTVRPLAMHVAPLFMCYIACATPGDVLSSLRHPVSSSELQESLTPTLSRCLQELRSGYASCGVNKAVVDATFAECAGGPTDPADQVDWWLRSLQAIQPPLSSGELSELSAVLDCATFTQSQRFHCECGRTAASNSSAEIILLPTSQAMPHGSASLGCLAASVGLVQDPLAFNAPSDVLSVRARLWSLGYLRGLVDGQADTQAEVEAALRTFLCACSGVLAFETRCDDGGISPCTVGGSTCALPTGRGFCVMDSQPCAASGVHPYSAEHAWLRLQDAPRWVELPASGTGFTTTPAGTLYGTSWLAATLQRAGFIYRAMSSSSAVQTLLPINVTAAALRDGGGQAAWSTLQTGLELHVALPVNTTGAGDDSLDVPRARTQIEALLSANFSVTAYLADATDLSAMCIGHFVCSVMVSEADRAAMPHGYVHARLQASATLERLPFNGTLTDIMGPRGHKVPLVLAASASEPDEATGLVNVTINGDDLGASTTEVIAVSVGDVRCVPIVTHPSRLVVSCALAPFGVMRGVAAVTTANGGTGVGCVPLEVNTSSAGNISFAAAKQNTLEAISQPAAVLMQRSDELYAILALAG